MGPLRIGVLGAARITNQALLKPAHREADVEVTAVAARDRGRAEAYAAKRGIPRVLDSYDALLADPDIDAIYNPLPNGLHGRWTIAALQAGKHVLCEKPFTANADEAEQVAEVEAATGLVVMEAFHYRYHPLAQRLVDIVADGTLGAIEHIDAHFVVPLLSRNDIRWQFDLAGGSTMDLGCYTIHLLRSLAQGEPEVVRARARDRGAGVDKWLQTDMTLPGGGTGQVTASMMSPRVVSIGAEVRGDKGRLRVLNPYAPHYFHLVSLRRGGRTKRFRVPGRTSYWYQLQAFVGTVERGELIIT